MAPFLAGPRPVSVAIVAVSEYDDQASSMGHMSMRAGSSQSGLPQLDRPGAFLKALGMKFDVIEPARVVGSIDVGPDHHTPWGVVQGGTCITAVESAAIAWVFLAVVELGRFRVGG